MKTFDVQERIVVYNNGRRLVGETSSGIIVNGKVWFQPDEGTGFWAHLKQVRRLKPATEAREWWVNTYETAELLGNGTYSYLHLTKESAEAQRYPANFLECVHIREVKEKKK